MKCIKTKDEVPSVVRCADGFAAARVSKGEYVYCKRSEWKKAGKKYEGPMPKAYPPNPNRKQRKQAAPEA